jgi:hypothetical protein
MIPSLSQAFEAIERVDTLSLTVIQTQLGSIDAAFGRVRVELQITLEDMKLEHERQRAPLEERVNELHLAVLRDKLQIMDHAFGRVRHELQTTLDDMALEHGRQRAPLEKTRDEIARRQSQHRYLVASFINLAKRELPYLSFNEPGAFQSTSDGALLYRYEFPRVKGRGQVVLNWHRNNNGPVVFVYFMADGNVDAYSHEASSHSDAVEYIKKAFM